MSSVNKVMLIGRLGKDPEVKRLENGTTIVNMTLATSEKYKDKSGTLMESTEWHNLTAYKKLAEICEKFLKKGDMAYFEGKLKTRSWDSNGVKKYATDIIVNNMVMLGNKPSNEPTNDLPFD